ncbi:MAG: hypothetical protein Q9178_007695 [Gyalolechia marmorata]
MAPTPHLLHLLPRRSLSSKVLLSFSLPSLFATATMSTTSSPPSYTTIPIPPPPSSLAPPTEPLPRTDPNPDNIFYSQPRFVTHIDEAAIERLQEYYRRTLWESMGMNLGKGKKRILDLCSSWISHFPSEMENLAIATARRYSSKQQTPARPENDKNNEEGLKLEVIGLGMNSQELAANPIFSTRIVRDLNASPLLSDDDENTANLDATTCVVSIDYLTRPITVLRSVLSHTVAGGTIHLVISNRCFPTKVAGEWLQLGEEERLEMVGRYLWWAGWRGVEVVDLCEEGKVKGVMGRIFGGGDPLWVVRGVKRGGEGGEGEGEDAGRRVGRTEL